MPHLADVRESGKRDRFAEREECGTTVAVFLGLSCFPHILVQLSELITEKVRGGGGSVVTELSEHVAFLALTAGSFSLRCV